MADKNYWNYRIIKTSDTKLKGLPQSYSYGIYEVHYTNDIPHSWSENPMYAIGSDWNELYKDYHSMFDAFSKKTLEIKDGKLVEGKMFK